MNLISWVLFFVLSTWSTQNFHWFLTFNSVGKMRFTWVEKKSEIYNNKQITRQQKPSTYGTAITCRRSSSREVQTALTTEEWCMARAAGRRCSSGVVCRVRCGCNRRAKCTARRRAARLGTAAKTFTAALPFRPVTILLSCVSASERQRRTPDFTSPSSPPGTTRVQRRF